VKIGLIGSGPIALGYAALLLHRGYEPCIWSPRDSLPRTSLRGTRIAARGLLDSTVEVEIALSPQEVAASDVIVLCVRGNGYKSVMEALAPHLNTKHLVIVSSHCSLGALYLSRLLASRNMVVPILALPTTVLTGSMNDGDVYVKTLRSEVDVAAVPSAALPAGLSVLRDLFGDVFVEGQDLLTIALSNLNPQLHMAGAVLNYTRMERGERWDVFGGITPSVGRLIGRLDDERLAIASAFGVRVRTAREHYLKSFSGLPSAGRIHEFAEAIAAQRPTGTPGPTTLESRWLTEDLPFGIATTIELGKLTGVATPLHEAGLEILSAAAGRDYRRENDILPALGLKDMTPMKLQAAARGGWPLPVPRSPAPPT
jgi:opine dehydrogenase